MSGVLSGLEKFGLESLKSIDIYKDKDKDKEGKGKKEDRGKTGSTGGVDMEVSEESILFDKTYTCPCCAAKFKAKAVRVGRNSLVRLDSDLRPIYKSVDMQDLLKVLIQLVTGILRI